MSAQKIVFLIADGMGDWPLDELGGLTPMAAAATPHMDELAADGLVGLCRTVPEGMPPGSDVANMALLGYDPARHHTGRGPIEAAAQGLELDEGDLVWRLNLVSVTEFAAAGTMLDYSAGHIATEAARELILDLDAHCAAATGGEFRMVPGIQYRHLLVQKDGAASPEAGLAIRPPHDITDQPIADDWEAYSSSPRLMALLRAAAARLAGPHNRTRATSLWPWGQGRPILLPSFADTFGLRGAVVSAVDLVRGLGRAAGMEVLEVEGVTGLLDTNYEGKVEAALDFLRHGDFVFLHVEAPDECGHAGNARDKVEAVARFDARVVGPVRRALASGEYGDAAIVIACDHLTPVARRTHVPDPVPFLLSCRGCRPSGVTGARAFTEAEAARTGLLVEPGHGLLAWALERTREARG